MQPKTWNLDLNNEFNQVFWQGVALDSFFSELRSHHLLLLLLRLHVLGTFNLNDLANQTNNKDIKNSGATCKKRLRNRRILGAHFLTAKVKISSIIDSIYLTICYRWNKRTLIVLYVRCECLQTAFHRVTMKQLFQCRHCTIFISVSLYTNAWSCDCDVKHTR